MSPFQARPRKRFGQHWLRSEVILDRIVAAAALGLCDRVLEIGPGTGLLTQRLMAQAGSVVAVEVDRDLCRRLRSQFGDRETFELIEGDVLKLDLRSMLAEQPRDSQFRSDPHSSANPSPHKASPHKASPNKVVANIPYYITGPILERLLGTIAQPNPYPFESIVLLVQQEVAQRLCARPHSKAFGALTVRVQYLADCEVICPVPAKAFQPPPKVASAVVRLTPRPIPTPAQNPQLLAQIVTLGFASKRKMLRNNLEGLIPRDRLLPLLAALEIPETARG
ncbi:16S rRNA (adenine(1518)-N(6)/adenine(1519)-N(6))-dimethyltransferase RsmA, partial [Leptolyngbya sp. PCC 6406]